MAQLSPRILAVLSLACGLIAAACASHAPYRNAPASELTGTRWVAQAVNGAPVGAPDAPTIVFGEEDRLSGTGGCNTLSAVYEAAGGFIDVRALSRTARLRGRCADAPGSGVRARVGRRRALHA